MSVGTSHRESATISCLSHKGLFKQRTAMTSHILERCHRAEGRWRCHHIGGAPYVRLFSVC
jgi:hypothetical protein